MFNESTKIFKYILLNTSVPQVYRVDAFEEEVKL